MKTTPQNIIELVLDRKTQDTQLTFYKTRLEAWLFWLSTGFACITAVAALAAYVTSIPYTKHVALGSLLIAAILSLIFQTADLIPELMKLHNYERELSIPMVDEFNHDMKLIDELVNNFDHHTISYAKSTFDRRARQMKERMAVFVGAIDKVGIIPMIVTGGMSFIKIKQEGIMPFGVVEWMLLAFVFMYLFAVRVTLAAQWMEKVAVIYGQALDLKRQDGCGEMSSKHVSYL